MRAPFLPLLLCAVVVAAACGGGNSEQAGAGAAGGRGAFPAMDVKTLTIAPKPIPQTSEFVATIRSLRSTNIQPQVEGFVRQIMVKAGDRVSAGQPLVQIDPEKQQATVAASQSQRASRDADLEFARQQLARAQKLFDAGAVSRAELEQAETAVKTADAQLATVNSQIRENQVQQQYVRARIVWSNAPAIAVPVVAVNRISGQYFVFVAEQGQGGIVARQKPITVGDLIGDSYIVRSGIKEGEKVIVSNIQKLQDGVPVKPEA